MNAFSHISSIISWKEKMCMENDFNNFFEVVGGQLKSRVLKKSFKRFLKKCDVSFLPYKADSDLKAKSANRAPFEASDCQNTTNM